MDFATTASHVTKEMPMQIGRMSTTDSLSQSHLEEEAMSVGILPKDMLHYFKLENAHCDDQPGSWGCNKSDFQLATEQDSDDDAYDDSDCLISVTSADLEAMSHFCKERMESQEVPMTLALESFQDLSELRSHRRACKPSDHEMAGPQEMPVTVMLESFRFFFELYDHGGNESGDDDYDDGDCLISVTSADLETMRKLRNERKELQELPMTLTLESFQDFGELNAHLKACKSSSHDMEPSQQLPASLTLESFQEFVELYDHSGDASESSEQWVIECQELPMTMTMESFRDLTEHHGQSEASWGCDKSDVQPVNGNDNDDDDYDDGHCLISVTPADLETMRKLRKQRREAQELPMTLTLESFQDQPATEQGNDDDDYDGCDCLISVTSADLETMRKLRNERQESQELPMTLTLESFQDLGELCCHCKACTSSDYEMAGSQELLMTLMLESSQESDELYDYSGGASESSQYEITPRRD
eukprot:TRINITY_DN12542_c0_g1_i2.p1 TRINITY_DN12542_c0_g1~~TRINITY_DN12542_c0_g1_i2.p1  ORF type:complete len:476 (-),score=110.43 TRINITY_DN12542_c0_g1_i2:124-1551(-)